MADRLQTVIEQYQRFINPGLARLIDFMGFGVIEERASGCYIYDHTGQAYLDFLGGFGVYALGHNPPAVAAAVRAQLDRQPMSCRVMLNEPQAALAARLAEITPGALQYSFFVSSGTEAVEGALKLARLYFHAAGRPRRDFVAAHGAYHGKTLGALSVSGRPKYQQPFEPLLPGCRLVPFGEVDALAAAVDADTAAVILEPIQGEAGVIVPPAGYLAAAREICDRHGAKLIADEVQTGFGRCGTLFACQAEGVTPDVMCLAKALGGGVMPLGAFIATAAMWEPMQPNPLLHSSTWGGNPLACAAGLAAIEAILEGDLAGAARDRGTQLLSGLADLAAAHPSILREVRGRGLLVGVEFTDEDIAGMCIAKLASRQILVAYTLNNPTVMRLEPPLIVSTQQVEQVLTAVREAVAETAELVALLADEVEA
ncbi:MAG: aminotransferase class III-fold pyridoxal phosphate-dependent enzyme [Fimbriimonadaceae bacterium]|nr:aminotransferase class III-fold pyridoxal phosphate-dependent enzyme [Fimbriimonadaceae bacterium]